jgi:AcrR family transcriptional regulator
MRDIARKANVSTATAYTYFASKEHVYAEAYLVGVHTLTERLRARPPRGTTAADRVASVFRRAVEGAASTGDVVQATAIALASSDSAVASVRPLVDDAFDEWMTIALAGARIADRASTLKALQLTMFAAFVAVAHGRLSLAEVGNVLDLSVRRMVIETANVPT